MANQPILPRVTWLLVGVVSLSLILSLASLILVVRERSRGEVMELHNKEMEQKVESLKGEVGELSDITRVSTTYAKSQYPDLMSGLQILQSAPWINMTSCADLCTATHACAGFARNRSRCHVLDGQPMGKRPYIYARGDSVYLREGQIEILAYRTSEHVRDSPYAVIAGTANTGHVITACDIDTKLKTTFKHPIMERWTDLPIAQVKLNLRDPDTSIKSVVFDATNSDKLSWMAQHRLMTSPWSDLTKTANANYLSVAGHLGRRFYINQSYGGCPRDYGWLLVLEKLVVCPWERQYGKLGLPTIIYSKLLRNVNFEDYANVGKATDLFILVVINIK